MERISSKYFFIAALAVLVIDQVSKFFMQAILAPGEVKPIVPGFSNLVYVWNPGIAFGFFGKHPSWAKYLLMGINLFAAFGLYILSHKGSKAKQIFCGLIAGGALGNLIDRVFHGMVFDFLDFYLGPYHWPAFNLADAAISIGVCGLIFLTMKEDF